MRKRRGVIEILTSGISEVVTIDEEGAWSRCLEWFAAADDAENSHGVEICESDAETVDLFLEERESLGANDGARRSSYDLKFYNILFKGKSGRWESSARIQEDFEHCVYSSEPEDDHDLKEFQSEIAFHFEIGGPVLTLFFGTCQSDGKLPMKNGSMKSGKKHIGPLCQNGHRSRWG